MYVSNVMPSDGRIINKSNGFIFILSKLVINEYNKIYSPYVLLRRIVETSFILWCICKYGSSDSVKCYFMNCRQKIRFLVALLYISSLREILVIWKVQFSVMCDSTAAPAERSLSLQGMYHFVCNNPHNEQLSCWSVHRELINSHMRLDL